MGLVPVKVTHPEPIKPNQYLQSEPDIHFQMQYPDIAALPLLHHTTDKNLDSLVTCLMNPGNGK